MSNIVPAEALANGYEKITHTLNGQPRTGFKVPRAAENRLNQRTVGQGYFRGEMPEWGHAEGEIWDLRLHGKVFFPKV